MKTLRRWLHLLAHDWHVSGCPDCAEKRAVLVKGIGEPHHVPTRGVSSHVLARVLTRVV